MNENIDSRSRKHIRFALKLAAVMIGAALLLSLARMRGWVDQAMVVRGINVVIGLALAFYGNAMPKMMYATPARSLRDATLSQAIGRVSSWAMTLSFLVWAALWAFAPPQTAKIGSIAAVGAAVLVMLGYTAWKSVASSKSGRDKSGRE